MLYNLSALLFGGSIVLCFVLMFVGDFAGMKWGPRIQVIAQSFWAIVPITGILFVAQYLGRH